MLRAKSSNYVEIWSILPILCSTADFAEKCQSCPQRDAGFVEPNYNIIINCLTI